MSEKTKICRALLFLLSKVIYPSHPNLVRNDSRTAKTIIIYLGKEHVHAAKLSVKPKNERTRSENYKLYELSIYEVLHGLSEESLRKYIRLLWKEGYFDFFFQRQFPDLGT